MPLSPARLLRSWPFLTALLFMGALVWLILPGMVVTLDDDFWYLRSVIKTFQKGRPWTDDWLTPWAASASSLAALLFKFTGSFTFAIHFQLAATAGLAAMGCALFLKRQGVSAGLSLTTPLLLLATPTILFMFLMFTGVALYMACLWWCLLLADRRQWFWFLLPWGIAVASRQSAVAWLALPGWALLQEAWSTRRWLPWTHTSRTLLTTFAAAAAIVLTCKLGMNPTAGQQIALGGFGHQILTPHTLVPLGLGMLAGTAGWGLASLLRLPPQARTGFTRRRLLTAPFLTAAGAAGAWWFQQTTLNTHDCYSDPVSAIVFPGIGGILGLALSLTASRPRPDAALAGLGAILLVALYGGRFDYHFNDALFFGIAAGFPSRPVLTSPAASPEPNPPAASWLKWSAQAVLILTCLTAAFWHGRSLIRLKAQQERTAAMIVLYEEAMRSGKLAPENVGMASFGYLGWLFQDYYAAHDGQQNPVLGGFSRYAQNWDQGRGTGIVATLPKSLRAWRGLIPTRNRAALRDAPDIPVLLEIKRPLFFGRHPVRYTLMRGPSDERVPDTLTLNPGAYQRLPFPLNDAEWRSLLLDSPPLP